MSSFRATVRLAGKTATGILVPPEVIEELGAGKRPAVRVTLAGYTYRTTVATRGGEFKVPLSADNREGAGVAAGDEVDVELALDTAPREKTVPPDLADALDAYPEAMRFFEGLTPTQRGYFVTGIEEAKTRRPASGASRRPSACCGRAASAEAPQGLWSAGALRRGGTMGKLILDISMSLDGYVAGPDQTLDEPLGQGGGRLHEWAFAAEAFPRAARPRGRRGQCRLPGG